MWQVVLLAITLLQVVILAYYNFRLVLTLTISLLTAKTILMTLFILRFDAMTGITTNIPQHSWSIMRIVRIFRRRNPLGDRRCVQHLHIH